MDRNFIRLLCLSFGLLVSLSIQAKGGQGILGSAYDEGSGDFLYSEHHNCREGSLLCSVEYRDALGDLIAHKRLDFSVSQIRPALSMHDYRRNKTLEVGFSERSDLVVDAGFDNFVRSRWTELSDGETVRFPFQVVGFDEPLKVRAKQDDSGSCPARELCLQISLDSWLLGLLTDPIGLSYSRSDRKLLRYHGPSNLQGEDGESVKVVIYYEYAVEEPLTGPQLQRGDLSFSF